jgi:hypothetical protein
MAEGPRQLGAADGLARKARSARGSQTLQSGEMHRFIATQAVALGQVSGPLPR